MRQRGLGSLLMKSAELIAEHSKMLKVMLTVLVGKAKKTPITTHTAHAPICRQLGCHKVVRPRRVGIQFSKLFEAGRWIVFQVPNRSELADAG
jgi:hypothetical protein